MTTHAEEYLNKVKELFSLYEKVKLCIIYAENFDPKDELYIAPINQLRSSLDHFFKAAAYPEDMEYELKEAKEHLDRAGYDAFEIMASNLGQSIVEKLKIYSTDTITNTFPEYYRVIKPKLIDVRAKLAELRKRKKDSESGVDYAFSSYFDEVLKLLEYNKEVDIHIPSLEEYKIRKNKEERRKIVKTVFRTLLIGIISAVIGGIIVYSITKDKKQEKVKIENIK